MEDRMSLEHAILGFLRYRPLSGYDLKKAFDVSVHHFWPADQGQIYRTLARMTERGWVEVEVIPQESRPNRKVYHVTEAGQEELRRWLIISLPLEQNRVPWLVQVFFFGQLDDEEILTLFERRAEQLRARVERYDQVPQKSAEYVKAVGSPREAFFWMLTLEYGITVNRAELEWVKGVIERLRRKEQPSE
jgi:DNA-binding PadR family transcriptional regulator